MKTVISTSAAPAAVGPYCQAMRAGDFLYMSGQLGLDPLTGQLAAGAVEGQTTQALKNIKAVLAAAGLKPENVVKTTVYLTNMADFATVNKIYAETFAGQPPARSCVAVAQLPLGGLVEIECLAMFD